MSRTGTAFRVGISLLSLYCMSAVSTRAQSIKAPSHDPPQLGIYVFVGERLTSDSMKNLPGRLIPFLRYSGYSSLEFCDWAFEYPESKRSFQNT